MDTKKLIGTIIGVTLFAVLIAGATFAWLTFGTTVGENTYQGTSMNFIVDYTQGTDVPYLPILDSKLAKPGVSSTNQNTTTGGYGVGISETELGSNEAAGLVVVMKKHNNSADGHAVISLTTTSETKLTKDGIVRWAICRDEQVETGVQVDNVCGGGTETDFSKALNTGLVSGKGTIVLLNDALLAQDAACDGGVAGDQTSANIAANTQSNNFFYNATTTVGGYTYKKIAATGKATNGLNVTQTCPGLSVNATGTPSTNNLISTNGVSYFVYFWLDGELIKNEHLDDQYNNEGELANNLYSGYIHATANQLQN